MLTRVVNDAVNRIVTHYGENGHTGVDLCSRPNEDENRVFVHSQGGVSAVVYDDSFYGNYIDVTHYNGFMTRYAHLQKDSITVTVGEHLEDDTQIAVIGNSGSATSRYLHFEVFRDGIRINPEVYLRLDFWGGKPLPSYQSHDSRYGWNPSVYAVTNDYAGNFGYNIDAIYLDVFKLRVHDMVTNEWLPWVEDRNDYAGNLGHAIDGVQVLNTDPTTHMGYRVHINGGDWLDWVSEVNDTDSGYAGKYGQAIDAFQVYVSYGYL